MESVSDRTDGHGSATAMDALAFELAPFDLVRTVEEVREQLAARRQGVELRIRYAVDVPRSLIGDAERLRQVLRILLADAVEHVEKGGTVTLAIQGERVREQAATLRLRIELSGPRIAGNVLEDLPELAAGGDDADERRRELVLCRRIIEHMGGRFGSLSLPGQGTFFWFNLVFPLDSLRARRFWP